MKTTHSVSTFLQALREAGLPCTKPTILSYEARGIISKPKNSMQYGTRQHRLYTDVEITQNIIRISNHLKHGKKNNSKHSV